MKIPAILAVMLILSAAALGAIAQPAGNATLPSRTSDAGGVRVVVKPMAVAPDAAAWEFEVVMDTHTKPLGDDIVRASVLADEGGRQYPALAWQGDPPGGHHRKGVLRFAVPAPKPAAIEIRMTDVGGPGKRVFQWTFK